ncbi:hypothetical protein F383_13488 [Gossypium arboreum]|uniref:Uncharacterized protein n=1 Tax=Gossypium arboreum TaxID=29729 RepID=A0A0B0NJX7_GOSAR|nr:hypothetical protein F383_13488 [Gossypium arboreum]
MVLRGIILKLTIAMSRHGLTWYPCLMNSPMSCLSMVLHGTFP